MSEPMPDQEDARTVPSTFDWKTAIQRELDDPWNATVYTDRPLKIVAFLFRRAGELAEAIRGGNYRWSVRKSAVQVAACAIALYEAHAPSVDEDDRAAEKRIYAERKAKGIS